ncbi:hypothetical protein [Rhizobium sp. CIAT894]|nr:hypothetical protein [Rhizobium sp. CIAT894]
MVTPPSGANPTASNSGLQQQEIQAVFENGLNSLWAEGSSANLYFS